MYLVAGMVAKNYAGPGVIFSFIIAAIASIFSGNIHYVHLYEIGKRKKNPPGNKKGLCGKARFDHDEKKIIAFIN